MAKNSASPIGSPSRIRLRAPTEGFIWLDSISEIVELVTPERFASSRCDSLCRARTKRSRPPISTLIGNPCCKCFGSNKYASSRPAKSMGCRGEEKDLLWVSERGRVAASAASTGAIRDPSSEAEHPANRFVLDAVHGQPAVQESAAAVRFRRGHALHHRRRPQGDRRLRRPLVRQCRPRPPPDRARRRAAVEEPRL